MSRSGAAVLGSPIAHSLSPVLHNAAYAALGLEAWTYRAIECDEPALEATLQALDDEGLAGVSLTMPLKRAVLELLDGSDDMVAATEAANTVLFGEDSSWLGANTDVPGFLAALERYDVDVTGTEPWLIGAGATARSALVALGCAGAAAVRVVARRPEVADELGEIAATLGVRLEVSPWSELAASAQASLVVATTPPGSTDPLAASLDSVTGTWFDVVYSPWPTVAAAGWERAGGQVISGLELLVEQAAVQIELMTGREAPVEMMRAAGLEILGH
jgi:shikimate dehydrogenase